MTRLRMNSFYFISLLMAFSSTARGIETKVKRTNTHAIRQKEEANTIGARLALLWGETKLEEETDWLGNVERFLGGSHSYSYSSDDDDDDDDDDNEDHDSPLNDQAPNVNMILSPNDINKVTNNLNEATIVSTKPPTAAPTTKPPTPSPTQDVTDEITEKEITEASIPTTSTIKHRKCDVDSQSHILVSFSYAVETTTKDLDFIIPLEKNILDSVADKVLDCDNERHRSLRNVEISSRGLKVVSVGTTITGTVSHYDCPITSEDADYCTVIEGKFNLGLSGGDDEKDSVRENVLSIIKRDIEDGRYLFYDIAELVSMRYLGPDPVSPQAPKNDDNAPRDDTTAPEDLTSPNVVAAATEQSHQTVYISLGSIGAVLIAVILGLACVKRQQHLKHQKEDEERENEFEMDEIKSTGLGESAEKDAGDTESDTSDKNKEACDKEES
eukprot:CAMPEP_0172486632 /NCGR_PEP_ID=MMETSP1066-20121228/15276_1 /TAXON_ID=671091 /ORGANISM="Coscinodiscus wailesii, Strain CCMP2513" /LENGTH=441 /DNA_ID=CAMNT_0013252703 /DNA_START=73 /DNA_END=1398 /DNA_ORIENTATION=+